MARTFIDGSSEGLLVNSAVTAGNVCSMAGWFNADSINTKLCIIGLCDKDNSNTKWRLMAAHGGGVGDPLIAEVRDNGSGVSSAKTSVGYTAATWHHGAAVFDGDSSRKAYLDGGNLGTNTTTRANTGIDRTTVGYIGDSTPSAYFDGALAELAIWSIALTAEEASVLAAGYSPLFVRPESLLFYMPLLRDDDNDLIGGLSLTAVGTPTISDHPRMIYPSRSLQLGVPAAAAGGSILPTVLRDGLFVGSAA